MEHMDEPWSDGELVSHAVYESEDFLSGPRRSGAATLTDDAITHL